MEKTNKIINERISFLKEQIEVSEEGKKNEPEYAYVYDKTICEFSESLKYWEELSKLILEEKVTEIGPILNKTIIPFYEYNVVPVTRGSMIGADGQVSQREEDVIMEKIISDEIELISDLKECASEIKEKFNIALNI